MQASGKDFHFLTALANKDMGCCHLWRVTGGQALICLK